MPYGGTSLTMDVDDLVVWHFAVLRSFDPEVSEVLCAVGESSTAPVFWDIGANKGACLYAVARGLPRARLVLIEPQPALQELIRHNMAQLAPGRHEIWDVAVGSEEGDFTLSVPEDNKGRASLVHHGDGASVTVHVITAEQLASQSEAGWPTLVKIDVEGFEEQVITTLEPALRSGACEAVVFESHQDETQIFADVSDIFTEHGYEVFGITRTPFTTRLTPAPTQLPGAMDYAALRPDVLSRPAVRRLIR